MTGSNQVLIWGLYEVATLDGVNSWKQFWHITLPGLCLILVIALAITRIFRLPSFKQVFAVTGSKPINLINLLVYYVYDQAAARLDFGYGVAATMLLLLATIILTRFQLRLWKPSE